MDSSMVVMEKFIVNFRLESWLQHANRRLPRVLPFGGEWMVESPCGVSHQHALIHDTTAALPFGAFGGRRNPTGTFSNTTTAL